jgi:hypothetical protein
MDKFVELAFQYVPKVIAAIKLLKGAPSEAASVGGQIIDAAATVKDLTQYVHRTLEHLKQSAPLNAEQEAQLDQWIEQMAGEDFWQPETT